MSRLVNSSVETALAQPHVVYGIFVDLDFTSGHLRAFNGIGEYTYNGQTYTGVGKFSAVGNVSERIDARDFTPLNIGLSGVPADLIVSYVPDRSEFFNRSATVYFVAFDQTTLQPLAVEAAIYEGFMDQLSFKREGNTASITVTIRHHSSIWERNIGLLYTHEHQRLISSTDDGCNQVHTEETKELFWGGLPVTTGGGGGGGGDRPPTRGRNEY